jgi:glutaredoxin
MLALMSNPQTNLQKLHVILYTRPGCHLCEEAKQAMRAAGCTKEYTLQEINIESDRELQHKYRYDIPVILIEGQEAFRHRLTSEQFKAALLDSRQARRSGP